MNSLVPPTLRRLLGEYERLTRDEGAAIRTQDFSTLAEIQSFKPALFLRIVEEGTLLGLDRRVSWFDECLRALAELEHGNVSVAAQSLRQLTLQRQSLESARKRLRGLGHAYRRTGGNGPRLFARS